MTSPRQRASDQISSIFQLDPLLESGENLAANYSSKSDTEAYSDGVIGVNKDGYISFINKEACKLTGWTQGSVENQKLDKIFQLKSSISTQSDIQLIQNVINSGHLFGPINIHTIKTKDNKELNVSFSLTPIEPDTVILMFHAYVKNKAQTPQSLLYQATLDPLTRLRNRHSIQQTISLLHESHKKAGTNYSMFLLNVDRFKLINDCYGNKMGDQLLQLIAERIQYCLRDEDNIGRWAGEEFICLMTDTDSNTAHKAAQRLCDDISKQPFLTDSQEISITASIGISSFPDDGNTPDELFSIADATLYEAKKNGRNRIHSSQQFTGNIYSIGSRLESALNEKRVTPVYQPIFDLATGKKVAEEALARIQGKKGELIEAHEFIDAAIELQMVHRIDYQIIMKMISRCTEQFVEGKNNLPHFVNISADLLRHPQLIKEIIQFATIKCDECGRNQCEGKPVVIEITEQELFGEKNEVKDLLAPFIDFGMPLAIDDFGSGYSSLSYLADLPISYLKFDGALIKRVAYEDKARKIINGIQKMAESLELITIAEHIENQATLDVLRELGVSWGQGYYAAKPLQ